MWAVVAVCLLTGGVLLLVGCDFAIPSFLNGRGAFCPKRIDPSVLEREQSRRQDLLGKVHEAELRLASMPDCPPAAPPQPDPPPVPPPPPANSKPDEGPKVGARGKLEVTLWWETTDDLDLWVFCPGGAIKPDDGAKGPGICGDGYHDADANYKRINPTSDPKEHVYWNANIPTGTYKAYVRPFNTANGSPIPYHVRVDFDGESKICPGQVYWDSNAGAGSAQYAIEFQPAHPLSDCKLVDDSLSLCTKDACRKP